MAKWKLKLMFEWGGGALWADDDVTRARFGWGGPVEEELPLSRPLLDRLEEMGTWHDTSLNWDYPPDPGPWTPEEEARFEAAAAEVLDWIRRELGEEYEVRYDAL